MDNKYIVGNSFSRVTSKVYLLLDYNHKLTTIYSESV